MSNIYKNLDIVPRVLQYFWAWGVPPPEGTEKTVLKPNGDVYVSMPSEENREKLMPLLEDEAFENNEIVNLKSKNPTISILNVKEFTTKEEFVEKVRRQNPRMTEFEKRHYALFHDPLKG